MYFYLLYSLLPFDVEEPGSISNKKIITGIHEQTWNLTR